MKEELYVLRINSELWYVNTTSDDLVICSTEKEKAKLLDWSEAIVNRERIGGYIRPYYQIPQ